MDPLRRRSDPAAPDAQEAYVDYRGYTWFPSVDAEGSPDGWWVRGVAAESGGYPVARYAAIESWYVAEAGSTPGDMSG